MLARATFIRRTIHTGRVHAAASATPWPEPTNPVSAVNQMAADVEDIPSTHRAVVNKTQSQSPREIFDSWALNSFYSPLDFLRSRRIRAATPRRFNQPAIGPGAKEAFYNDAFRQLNIDPVEEVNNTALLGSFMTVMGKIRPRASTGLSWRSQRKVAQAIKRAKQKGVIAILSNKYTNTKIISQ